MRTNPIRRSLSRWFSLALLAALLCSLGNAPAIAAAQPGTDASNAAAAAFYYSQLEAAGDYNTEYDFIHPDARAIIPRAAVVGWFKDNYWPRQPSPATVTGVRFISWTWEVTGVTYPYTAEVSYQQVFWDGGANTVENDVVRLVQDRNGVWRWFFGRSRQFVNDVIAQYVPSVATTVYTGDSFIDGTASDLDSYWRAFFRSYLPSYNAPNVVEFDQDTMSGCGVLDPWTEGSGYCALDQTIYLNVAELLAVQQAASPFTVQLVLAHEWGHHIQFEMGNSGDQVSMELQADCLAGAWGRDFATRGGVREADLFAAMSLFAFLGDPTHGFGTQRSKELLDGFYDGTQACFS